MPTLNIFILVLCLVNSMTAYVTDYPVADYADIGIPITEIFDQGMHQGTNQNWWLAKTENGIIYNGTGIGLNEWDGEKWSFYNTPQNSRIRSVSPWRDDKIYVGTTNNIGYYGQDENGSLQFTSLIEDWTFEQHQFGEIWSTAANLNGVLFSASNAMYFWDGKTIQTITDGVTGIHRIFAMGDKFIYKQKNQDFFQIVYTKPILKIERSELSLPAGVKIRQILFNQKQNMLIFTDQYGIYELIEGELIKQVDEKEFPEEVNIYHAIQASDGYYYVSSLDHGLFILSPELKVLRQYTQEHNLGMNKIYSVMEDNQGNIWLSGVSNIVKMRPPHLYSTFQAEGGSKLLERINLFQNKVTVVGDRAYQIEKPENELAPYHFKIIMPEGNMTFGFIQYKGHLFSGTTQGVFTQNIDNETLFNHTHLIDVYMSKNFAIDSETDTLFATTYSGLYRIKLIDNQWQYDLIGGTRDELQDIVIDDDGIIWVGTPSQELYKIENAQYEDKETKIQKFTGSDGLGPNNVIPFKLSFGVVFGTNDGLMDFEINRQPQLQFVTGLPKLFNTKDMDVYRLYEDEKNRIWFRISGRTGYIEKDANEVWQMNEDIFKSFPDSGYKGFILTDTNIMWVAMANGQIFRLNTALIDTVPKQGRLNIRKVINLDTDKEIYGGINSPILPLLDQQNNSIRINFALTENIIQDAKKYRHRLLGSDYEKWSKWSIENHKDYTLLRGNDYQFQLESKDGWNRLSSAELNFTVSPAWYLSRTAWIIYLVSLGFLLIATAWITQKWRTKKLNQRNIELEQQVKERTAEVQTKAQKLEQQTKELEQQTKELEQQQVLKDRFFSNVSHEFRTPLTLTIAPLKSLVDDNPNLDKSLLHPIKTALRNSKKMLSLVGQVLDVNRLESGRFPLKVAQYDITDLIHNSIKRFNSWAQQHDQTLSAIDINDPLFLYFDLDQLEKCLSNLISNAIKYSGEGSQIKISLIQNSSENDDQTGIKVSDNGRGISHQFEDKVFQRYTQDESSEHITEPGTGIGLALVKELIELHHGHIELINKPEVGCSFILWLKGGHEHFENSQLIEPISLDDYDPLYVPKQMPKTIDDTQNQDITTILVVDDSTELREFIVSRLSSYYRILQAANGQEGFAMAQTKLPDLIISDVMMPVMNGFEMTKKLKSSETSKHIPIILLTAKTSKRETVEGLQAGADDYLTKPFDTSELIVRVKGIIDNRKVIRKEIMLELSKQHTNVKNVSTFIDKLRQEILDQLSNPKLNIESLSTALAMSRSSLNRKCHEELDKSPMQYTTEIRMQHALILLKNNKHSVSDIAYGIGYESLAYFSRVFKKYFGRSPTSIN